MIKLIIHFMASSDYFKNLWKTRKHKSVAHVEVNGMSTAFQRIRNKSTSHLPGKRKVSVFLQQKLDHIWCIFQAERVFQRYLLIVPYLSGMCRALQDIDYSRFPQSTYHKFLEQRIQHYCYQELFRKVPHSQTCIEST